MKINAKRIIAMLLTTALILGLAACSAGNKEDEVENNNVVNGTFTDFLIAEKIGTINRDSFVVNNGGLTYSENGLYGVISYEGLYDTGAIFSYVSAERNYFEVRENNPVSVNDVACINSAYLIDGRGNLVVPGAHAAYDVLNERYVFAATVTKFTNNKDNAIVMGNADLNSFITTTAPISEGDVMYEGTWCIYDITTGAVVPGAQGNARTEVSANGELIRITNPVSYEYVEINFKGELIPEGAFTFENGTFRVDGEEIGAVYAADGTKIFEYDVNDYVPFAAYGKYYAASKIKDGASVFAILTENGEILSEGYTHSPVVYSNIVHCGDKIYNLQGENIIDGTYTSVTEDKMFGKNWFINVGDEYTMIDEYGNVFYSDKEGDGKIIWYPDFVAEKHKEDGYYFYSYKDNDYTIYTNYGRCFAPWIVKTSNDDFLYNLVDTMTGETLLEGYEDYSSIAYDSYAYYVYAEYQGGTDVYLIISGSQIADVTETKADLYNDLAAAFEAEGINAAVNKENGEIALDTAVLFGGDSAVLTDAGKAVLDKFIRAYSNVVYSDKYNGFITKTLVEGHAAPLAGSTYASGYDLSVERATNVMNYCIGVDASSPVANTLEAVGYSNSQPIYNEDGSVNLEASRRVSFRFMVNIEL